MSVTLYFREGTSDKIYRAAIEEKDGGYVVNYAYGRRGSTLATGTKTNSPVSHDEAKRIYDKLVRAKLAKGYRAVQGTAAYTVPEGKMTDIRPQLLNPTDDVEALLADDAFYMQPKHDGKRLLVRRRGAEVTGINRRGLECGLPESIRVAALALPGDFILDGEGVGETLHVFDLLEAGGKDRRSEPYKGRLLSLINLLASGQQTGIQWVETARGEPAKRRAFTRLREELSEGVVFKRMTAPYWSGRPASGGDQLKFKFVETASVVVSAINAKRSVAVALWERGLLVPAGNVTLPPDQPIPSVGEVAEVRYLYAMPGSGSLFQPVYLGARDDITPAECHRDQLKFRKEPQEAAA